MTKYITHTVILTLAILMIGGIWLSLENRPDEPLNIQKEDIDALGTAPRIFLSSQVGTSPQTDYILSTDGTSSTWIANAGGGGGGGTGLFEYDSGTDTISPITASTSNTAILKVSSITATGTPGTATSTFAGAVQYGTGYYWDAVNERLSIGGQENSMTVNGVTKAHTLTTHITGGSQDYTWTSHVHSNTVGPVIAGARSRGSEASEAIVVDGDNLLDLVALGYDGTDYEEFAAIHMDVDGTPGNDDAPGMIRFLTTPNGSTSLAERMRIDQAGNVGIGSTSPSSKLTVGGEVKASNIVATSTTASSTFKGITWTSASGTAEKLVLNRIGNSTFSTVQDLQNIFHSTGYISGGAIADIGGGAVSVAAGTGLIRTSNSAVALMPYFDWVASTTVDIATDSIRYIGVEYNSGSPRVAIRTTYDWNLKTDFPLGNVVNEGGTLHLENAPQAVGDHAANMIERTFESLGKARDNITGGLIIGETGTRNVTMSAGTLWERLTSFDLSAIDTSSSGGFDTYCNATKIATASTTWDNANYCNSGTLTALSNNRYAVLWFYIELDGGLIMQYGTAQYVSEAGAEAEGAPSTVTNRVIAQSKLIGRFIFQESASTAASIESVFDTFFAGAIVTDHGNLAGLSDDDHTQYLLADGTRALAGNWDIGGFDLDNIGNSTTTNATSTNLAVTGAFNFLGTIITNVSTWFNGLFDTQLATKDTDDLTEGSNLYYTNARVSSYITGSSSVPSFEGTTNEVMYWTGSAWDTTATTSWDTTIAARLAGTHITLSTNTFNVDDNLSSYTDDLTHYLDTDVSSYLYGSTTRSDLYTAGNALTWTGTTLDFDGGNTPAGELGGSWSSPTIDDSLAVSSWNLTTPTLTTFFGTPCTGQNFLQDIGDTGAFTCTAVSAGASAVWATTTGGGADLIIEQDITQDLVLGANATATAPFWFDVSTVTSHIGSGGAGDSVVTVGTSPDTWTFGFDDTDNSFTIASGTVLGTNNALVLDTLGNITTGVWQGTVIGEIYGGTNQTSYTTGDILYASAANTLSKLGIGSDTEVLTLSGGIPTWAAPSGGGGATTDGGDVTYVTSVTDDFAIGGTASNAAWFFDVGLKQASTTDLFLAGTATTTNLIATSLTSALTLTGANGRFAEYTGTTCTNQFMRALSALGVATCETADISADTNLAVGNGITLTGDTLTVTAANGLAQAAGGLTTEGNLEDLNTVGAVGANSEFLVGTGVGTLAWESGATARTSLGVDVAGTDNSTDVTLIGTPDYITIDGSQVITRAKLDISDDTNATGGVGIDITTNDFTFDLSELGTETTIASGDFIAMEDITDNGSQKITFANFESDLTLDNQLGTLSVGKGGTGITSLGTGIATWWGTPSSANLAAALTDKTGTGVSVFATAPTFTTSLTVTGGGVIDADGVDLVTANDYEINGASVLTATTLGGAVVNSSLTNLGTLTALNLNGNLDLIATGNRIDFDTDNDTSIRASADDVFSFEQLAVDRTVWGLTDYSFNDTNLDMDFNIGGDTIVDLFHLDAGLDRVGIGSTTPNSLFGVAGTTTTETLNVNDPNHTGTSTMYIYSGTSGFGGEVILEDSDGAGCTSITVLNGTVSGTTVTCPANPVAG